VTAEALPLVSILIPAYNHERFVLRCLDSVLEDTYPAKELVVIDDGSIDGTAAKIAGWIARHEGVVPVTFRQRANRGVAATLNELASLARGDFLRLGASDDYFLPGGTEALVRYLLAHPRKSAVVGDSVVVDRYDNRLHGSGMRGLHGADKRRYATDEGIRRAVIAQWAIGGPSRRSSPAGPKGCASTTGISSCAWSRATRSASWMRRSARIACTTPTRARRATSPRAWPISWSRAASRKAGWRCSTVRTACC
jgi:hypothetical protein